jgi:hypothetical protein
MKAEPLVGTATILPYVPIAKLAFRSSWMMKLAEKSPLKKV